MGHPNFQPTQPFGRMKAKWALKEIKINLVRFWMVAFVANILALITIKIR